MHKGLPMPAFLTLEWVSIDMSPTDLPRRVIITAVMISIIISYKAAAAAATAVAVLVSAALAVAVVVFLILGRVPIEPTRRSMSGPLNRI